MWKGAIQGSTIVHDAPKGDKAPPPQTDNLRKLLKEYRDTWPQLCKDAVSKFQVGRAMIASVPSSPVFPTANPKRRNMIAPRIVLMLARNTGAAPNW